MDPLRLGRRRRRHRDAGARRHRGRRPRPAPRAAARLVDRRAATSTGLAAGGADVGDDELERRRSAARGDTVATLIYTSGTTGRPKGCELTHAQLPRPRPQRRRLPVRRWCARPGPARCCSCRSPTSSRGSSRCSASPRGPGWATPPTSRTWSTTSARSARRSCWPCPGSSRRSTTPRRRPPRPAARAGSSAAAAATAIAYSTRARQRRPGLRAAGPARALRPARLRQAAGTARRAACSTPSPAARRSGARLGHFFRGVGVVVLEGWGLTETTAPGHGQHPRADPGRHGRAAAARRRRAGRGRRRAARARRQRAARLLQQPRGDGRGARGRLVPHRRPRRDRRRRLRADHRAARRRSSSPRAARTWRRWSWRTGCARTCSSRSAWSSATSARSSPRWSRSTPRCCPTWLANNGKQPMDVAAAAQDPDVRAELQRAVDHANEAVSKAESIRKFLVLDTDFTEAGGHLTPEVEPQAGGRDEGLRAPGGEPVRSEGDGRPPRRGSGYCRRPPRRSITLCAWQWRGRSTTPCGQGPGRRGRWCEVEGLTVRFGAVDAVRGIDLAVAAGRLGGARRAQRRRQVDDPAGARRRGARHRGARARRRRGRPPRPAGGQAPHRLLPRRRRARAALHPLGAPAARRPAARADRLGARARRTCSSGSTSPTWPTA